MAADLQPALVRPRLYLSSLRTELCRPVLEEHGITHVLQVGFELTPSHPGGFQYLQLPVYDVVEQDMVSCFPAAFEFIERALEAGGSVLVHCQAGVSRSATVVIGYCMWKDRASAAAATAAVTRARPCVWPNAGFACQLREFEALGWDPAGWGGWGMDRFLETRYGGESVGFMAGLLGGPPPDRIRTGALPPPAAAAAAAARVAPGGGGGGGPAEQQPAAGPRHQGVPGQASTGAATGGGSASGDHGATPQQHWCAELEEAALLMAG